MDSLRRKSTEEENIIVEEVLQQQKDPSIRKNFSTLKEENDKLRTYLGLVKMCNYSAVSKIKSALNETINTINDSDIDSPFIVKQLEIIQNEITNMQSMHSKLEEGIESFQVIETNSGNSSGSNAINSSTNEEINDQNNRETVVVLTTRYEVPRKSTGIRKSNSKANKSKSKASTNSSFNAKLLNRLVENKSSKPVPSVQLSQTTIVCSEQQEAVASIDNTSSCEERENVVDVSDVNDVNELVRVKMTKRPYISEEFKSSHLQRLVEAKRRREEMNKQLEREGKRKPKIKRSEDQAREVGDNGKKSPKKRQTKKKVVGKVMNKKKIQSQPIATAQSIVVPINQSTLDSLSGQTIQIIASGGTQILCRNDGTFIPASNNNWQTTNNTQWTTADSNNYSQSQWTTQYHS